MSVSKFVTWTVSAFMSVAAGSCAPRTPVKIAAAADLSVRFTAPQCVVPAPPLSKETVLEGADPNEEQRIYWHMHGCFPVPLTGPSSCEWACVATHGGPCGNGGVRRMLLVVIDNKVVSTFGVRDEHDDFYRRDFILGSDDRGPLLQVNLVGTKNESAPVIEIYRLIDGELKLEK